MDSEVGCACRGERSFRKPKGPHFSIFLTDLPLIKFRNDGSGPDGVRALTCVGRGVDSDSPGFTTQAIPTSQFLLLSTITVMSESVIKILVYD
jgi:hypothetical protein